jgi:small subunit ribosomal protein S6
MRNNYESVIILTPVLSDQQMKDVIAKFTTVITENGGEIVNAEEWGLKELAYPINHKQTGYYAFLEFAAPAKAIAVLDTEFRRDERVVRYLTTVLDKHAVAYNTKRRSGAFNKKKEEVAA